MRRRFPIFPFALPDFSHMLRVASGQGGFVAGPRIFCEEKGMGAFIDQISSKARIRARWLK